MTLELILLCAAYRKKGGEGPTKTVKYFINKTITNSFMFCFVLHRSEPRRVCEQNCFLR